MPIREYKCTECGFQFESIDLGDLSDPKSDRTRCKNCGSSKVTKKFSLFSSPIDEKPSSGSTKPSSGGLG